MCSFNSFKVWEWLIFKSKLRFAFSLDGKFSENFSTSRLDAPVSAELSIPDLGFCSTVRFRQFCEFVGRVLLIEFCVFDVFAHNGDTIVLTGLTLEDVLELSADELREELADREIDDKGMSKVEMQKAFIKILFPAVPVAPVVTQPVSPRTALSPQQLMELEVMKLKMESEEREKRD